MNMKWNNLIRAVGLLLVSSITSQALALPPTATPDYTVYTSGSSSQQLAIGKMFTSYCKTTGPGIMHEYQNRYVDAAGVNTTDKQGSHFRAYFCTFKDATDVAPLPTDATLYGKNVLLHHRAKGGSIWGVVPVTESWQVEYMNILGRTGNRACTVVGTTYGCPVEKTTVAVPGVRAGTLPFENELECAFDVKQLKLGETSPVAADNTTYGVLATDTLCRRSHGGFSDEEPGLFAAPNYPAFPAPTDPSLQANLVSTPAYGVVFGVSVDKKVYDDLQTQQGLAGLVPGPIVSGLPTTVDCSLAANKYVMGPCAPSLSDVDIIAIFTGKVQNWNSGFGLTTVAGGSGDMAVCRRVVGSGAQAAANAYFLDNPCIPNGNFTTAIDSVGYKVIENSASYDVITCHNQMFAGTCATCGTFDYGSIGFNAIEKQPTASDNWAYIKISRIEPTVANYVPPEYKYAYESTILRHTGLLVSSDEYRTMTMVANDAPNPTFLKLAGVAGVAALCSDVAPILRFSPGTLITAPVTRMTRGGNSCHINRCQ